MRIRTAIVVTALLLAAPTPGQLRINEVQFAPPGPDGRQMIELMNTGSGTFTPTGWSLWSSSGVVWLPSLDLPPGPFLLQVGGRELSEEADYRVNLPELKSSDTLTLFGEEEPEERPRVMEDFVSWGGGTDRIYVAVAVGRWSDAADTVPLPTEGGSIARLNPGYGLEAWYVDSSPTLGLDNDPARYGTIVGSGCPGSAGTPTLTAAALPWLGGVLTVDLGFLPPDGTSTFGVMATGLDTWSPHLDLGPYGLPGCTLHVQTLANSFFAVRDGVAQWSLPIPDIATLEGLRFFNQALVQDFAAGNPRQAVMSNAVSGIIGGR